ncbi:YbaK/EbsC family protein [Aminithiophilus ramosus]|nr:YbaK/EbsC family protein [Aminithiophilus ramosus]
MMQDAISPWEGSDPVARVEKALRERGYAGTVLRSEATIFTVDDAARAIGAHPEEILKTIVLVADGKPLLALMRGPNRIHTGKVKRFLGARKVSMASPEVVYGLSGFRIGGVAPVGYPQELPALLDEDLFLHDTVWAAAGTDHAFFPVAPVELQRLTGGEVADIRQ